MTSSRAMDKYVFTWRIINYSSGKYAKGECIDSPEFDTGKLCGRKCYLSIYPKGDLEGREGFISCDLTSNDVEETSEAYSVNFRIELVDEEDTIFASEESGERVFEDGNSRWCLINLIDIDKLANEMMGWKEDILTIRCIITDAYERQDIVNGSGACTTIGINKKVIESSMDIPVVWPAFVATVFQHYDIATITINTCRFQVSIKQALLPHIKIKVQVLDELMDAMRITFKLTILDKIGCMLESIRATHVFEFSEEEINLESLVGGEKLESCKIDASHYGIKIRCEAIIANGTISHECIEEFANVSILRPEPRPKFDPPTKLHKELKNILISKKNSDVIIRTENEDFHAHKFVLGLRSPVFDAMFNQNLLEKQTGVVNVTDVDRETVKAFIEYLYAETLEIGDYKMAKKLILAADKYQVPSLVDECAYFIKSAICVENVCEIIKIADMINCDNLKLHALNFIKLNATKILSSVAWSQLIDDGNVKLASYILSNLSTDFVFEYKLK